MKKVAIFSTMALAVVSIARADLQVTLLPGQPTGSGPFLWNYDVVLEGGPTGAQIDDGDLFTIYDVGGITGTGNIVDSIPADWTISTQLLGINPPGLNPPDSPGILNVTLTFAGTNHTAVGANGSLDLGTVTITSADNFSFTGQEASISRLNPGDNPRLEQNSLTVPGSATPEPTTLLLLGGGLTAFGLLRWRRKA